MADDHEKLGDVSAFHKPAGGKDGGACLSRHQSSYAPNNSCSYRWQGSERAKGEDKTLYTYEAPDGQTIDYLEVDGYRWMDERLISKAAHDVIASAGEKKSEKTVTKGKKKIKTEIVKKKVSSNAFRTGFAPFNNQVHHIVPVSPVIDRINATSRPNQAVLRPLILKGLRKETYNINHEKNVIALPTKGKVARNLGLPTHYGSHPNYSKQVKTLLKKAFKPYEKIVSDVGKKKHPKPMPDPANVKAFVEKISDTIHSQIKVNAAATKGTLRKIDDLSEDPFWGTVL